MSQTFDENENGEEEIQLNHLDKDIRPSLHLALNFVKSKKILDLYKTLLKASFISLSSEDHLQAIIYILMKPKNRKNALDAFLLQKAFSQVEYFRTLEKELSSDLLNTLYKSLEYSFCPKRSPIFEIGDVGTSFYIIIKGSVHILIKKKNVHPAGPEDKNQFESRKKEFNQLLKKKRSTVFNKDGMTTLKDEEEEASSPTINQNEDDIPESPSSPMTKHKRNFSKKIRSETRQSIKKFAGMFKKNSKLMSIAPNFNAENIEDFDIIPDEVFLDSIYPDMESVKVLKEGDYFGEIALTKNVRRQATVLAKEETHLAFLNKKDFSEILKKHYETQTQLDIEFLKTVVMFKHTSGTKLNQVAFLFKKKEFVYDDLIYSEGEIADSIFIIKDGSVENEDDSVSFKKIKKIGKKKDKSFIRRLQVSLLGTGEMFGYDEVVRDTSRKHRARCISSKATILIMSKEDFLRSVTKDIYLEDLKSVADEKRERSKLVEQTLQSFITREFSDPIMPRLGEDDKKLLEEKIKKIQPKNRDKSFQRRTKHQQNKLDSKPPKQLNVDNMYPFLHKSGAIEGFKTVSNKLHEISVKNLSGTKDFPLEVFNERTQLLKLENKFYGGLAKNRDKAPLRREDRSERLRASDLSKSSRNGNSLPLLNLDFKQSCINRSTSLNESLPITFSSGINSMLGMKPKSIDYMSLNKNSTEGAKKKTKLLRSLNIDKYFSAYEGGEFKRKLETKTDFGDDFLSGSTLITELTSRYEGMSGLYQSRILVPIKSPRK